MRMPGPPPINFWFNLLIFLISPSHKELDKWDTRLCTRETAKEMTMRGDYSGLCERLSQWYSRGGNSGTMRRHDSPDLSLR
jgi:hypothetical protein